MIIGVPRRDILIAVHERTRTADPAESRDAKVRGRAARRPLLSVVVPCFNQGRSIYRNVGEIVRRLERAGLDHELIVVSDGSSDTTVFEAARHPGVRVLRYDRNLGKGYALRTGSTAARGAWIAWIDSDLDLDPSLLSDFLDRAQRDDLEIVIGSKRHPESEVSYPLRRRAYSWLYQQLIRVLFSLRVRDTQVGMKLFRREVLDQVLPVVLVKRYAFDLEILAVAHDFGFDRIAEAPVRLNYRFGDSGVDWRAIAQALWDTAAIFYRARLLRYYERRRLLARRILVHRPERSPSLTVLVAPSSASAARECVRRIRPVIPVDAEIVIVDPRPPEEPVYSVPGARVVNAGLESRRERLERAACTARSDVVALLDERARPSDSWAESALRLFGDPTVGAVVGPVVPLLGGNPAEDATGILKESRLGVGGARIRHHVGSLREVDDFPSSNLFVRTSALREALRRGAALDDDLCGALRRRHGLSVLCSPDVVVTVAPEPIGRYLAALHGLGRRRGARLGGGRLPRPRHLLPAAVLPAVLLGPLALARGGHVASAWKALATTYAATVGAFGALVLVLHRRPAVAAIAGTGAIGSHVAFGAGVLRGAGARLVRLASRRALVSRPRSDAAPSRRDP